MNTFYALFPLVVGALIPVQARINGKLFSLNQNAIFTSLISVIVSGSILLIVYFSTAKEMPSLKAPWWLYTGGVVGAFYLAGLAWAAPKVSTTQLVAGLLGGQIVMALLIDYFTQGKVSLNQVIATGLVIIAVLIKK